MSSELSQSLNSPLKSDTALARKIQRRSRLMGLAVLTVVFLPMAAAYVMFKTGLGIPTGTVNKGDLLFPPLALELLGLEDAGGNSLDLLEGEKKWRLLIPAGATCDSECQQSLFITRQVHVRLGEKSVRVERYYLNTAAGLSAETKSFIKKEHPRLKQAYIKPQELNTLLEASSVPGARYFLMDQEGYVMMSYSAEHTGNELLDDIKRLLKYSYAG